MLLKILLLAQQALIVSSFTGKYVPYGFITTSPHRMRQIPVFSTKGDDSEFFSLGDVNTKSKIDRDTFLFGEKVSFASCGVGAELTAALEATGKFNPTSIQVKTFSAIAAGRDVIIGAETGSGKTLSYLLPLIQGLLDEETKDDDDDELSLSMGSYPSAIIMVPNKELCSQVYRMANELISHIPQKEKVSIGLFTQVLDRWPYSRSQISPKIAVCTPAFLANFIRGPNILEENLFRSLRQLVLDEADMLLEGSYLGDVEKVVESFRLIRREMIREGQIDINDRVLQNILVAATLPSYGLRSIEKYIEKRFPLATRISNDHLHKHHPRIEQSFIKTRGDLLSKKRVDLVVRAIRGEDISIESDIAVQEEEDDGRDGDFNASDFMGSDPEPESDSDAAPVVPFNDEDIVQTMIFVNTADTASRLAIELGKAGVRSAEYHKFVSDADKQESLRLFREEEVSVLVCTDHASRGLDLPNVRHVIQAEFAGNVVQYLHRIGRASRAGVLGKATNIYDDKSADLVTSILSDSEEKKIDQSFSRRRGFRQKIKKDFRRTTGWTPPEASNDSQY